jgi:hypothetical protein
MAIRATAGLDEGISPDGILENETSDEGLGGDYEEMSFETTGISATGSSVEL